MGTEEKIKSQKWLPFLFEGVFVSELEISMLNIVKNKLSNGLLRLLTQKDVQHFNKITDINFSDLERDNYFRQFEHAQVAEIAEYGLPQSRR